MSNKSETRRREDYIRVFKATTEELRGALTYFDSEKIDTIRPGLAKERLLKFMGPDVAASLIRVSSALLFSQRNSASFDSNKAIDSITFPEQVDDFSEKKEILKKIVKSEKASAISKAIFLSFESEKIFSSMTSIVDVRPVFNKDKTETIANIIVPQLRINFYERNNEVRQSITLCTDEADLSKIANALSEVIQKIKVIKSGLSKADGELYIVAGDTVL